MCEKRYGYHDWLPSIHEIDQLLQVSSWMVSKHSTFSSLSWKDILENNERRTLEKSYAFSCFGPFCKISKVFPQAIVCFVYHVCKRKRFKVKATKPQYR
jgi:hypothetical protein